MTYKKRAIKKPTSRLLRYPVTHRAHHCAQFFDITKKASLKAVTHAWHFSPVNYYHAVSGPKPARSLLFPQKQKKRPEGRKAETVVLKPYWQTRSSPPVHAPSHSSECAHCGS